MTRPHVPQSNLFEQWSIPGLIGNSEAFKTAARKLGRALRRPKDRARPVTLVGSPGTGKTSLVSAVTKVLYPDAHFVRVDCTKLDAELGYTEVFGYDDAAFSGARRGGKKGYLHKAEGGVIFFDEVFVLGTELQAALLSLMNGDGVSRKGSTTPWYPNVRIVCASWEMLKLTKRQRNARFRPDLWHRIRRTIKIPGLHERDEDVLLLAEHFLAIEAQGWVLGEDVRRWLMAHRKEIHKAGDVRVLDQMIEDAVEAAQDLGQRRVSIDALRRSLRSDGDFDSAELPALTLTPTREGVARRLLEVHPEGFTRSQFQAAWPEQLEDRNARIWLKGLRDQGVIEMTGSGTATRYVRPEISPEVVGKISGGLPDDFPDGSESTPTPSPSRPPSSAAVRSPVDDRSHASGSHLRPDVVSTVVGRRPDSSTPPIPGAHEEDA